MLLLHETLRPSKKTAHFRVKEIKRSQFSIPAIYELVKVNIDSNHISWKSKRYIMYIVVLIVIGARTV